MSEYRQSTIELLCIPFLDTDTEKLRVDADTVLQNRGYALWVIRLLRKVVGIGLWTQSIAWEEWHLGWIDVLFGYALLFIPLGIMLLVIGNIFGTLLFVSGALMLMFGFSTIVGLLIYALCKGKRDSDAKP